MEDRVERLVEELVEQVQGLVEQVRGLVEEVREMRLILEKSLEKRLIRRRLGGRGGTSEGVVGVGDLTEEEKELVRVFLDWARSKWSKWAGSYENGELEGYDGRRGLLILRKGTMNEFLNMARDLGFSKQDVLRLLGNLKILKYWERGAVRQYSISIRVDKPAKWKVNGCYVLDVMKMRDVSQELRLRGLSEGE